MTVHLASKTHRRLHLIRLNCGCEQWVRPDSDVRPYGRHAVACEGQDQCRFDWYGQRCDVAVRSLGLRTPQQPSLFPEVA